MAIADKLQSILDSKKAIKAAIEKKGIADVGDIFANYPDKILSIPSGGGSGINYTGHADTEGLKAIGWTDDDIAYYQKNGVNWNEEDDEYHKVPQDNIDLYGLINEDNIRDYSDILVYLPKIDITRDTLSFMFVECTSLVAIPLLDTSNVTSMDSTFVACMNLVSIPLLDTSNVTSMDSTFSSCTNLVSLPPLNTSRVNNMSTIIQECHLLSTFRGFDTNLVTEMMGFAQNCNCLKSVHLDMSNVSNADTMFYECFLLSDLRIDNLKQDLYVAESSLLTKDSLIYTILNSDAPNNITITLSEYSHNKFKEDQDIISALASKPNVSIKPKTQ